jgi:hypothetical protein
MQDRLPARFWVELALGVVSAVLLALAVMVPDWIEVLLSGAAPDGGDGSTEWGLALLWASVSVLMFGLAGRSWLRPALRPD